MTITELRTSFERLKHDISDVSSAQFMEWVNAMDDYLYRTLVQTEPENYVSSVLFTITSSPQTSTLPTNFKTINTLGCGFYEMDGSQDTSRILPKTGHGANQKGYYIKGTSVIFTGAEGLSVKLRYIPKRAQYTTTSDDVILEEEYLYYMLNAIDILYNLWDEQVGAESYSDVRFIRAMTDLIENIKKDTASIGINDYSTNY